MTRTRRALTLFIILFSYQMSAASDLKLFRNLSMGQQNDEALRILKQLTEPSKDQNTRALAQFGLGVLYHNQNQLEESSRAFYEALQLGTRLEDFSHYYLGLNFKKQANLKEAKTQFEKVINAKPVSQKFYEARFHLGEIALEEKKPRDAEVHFRYLEKKTRRTPQYTAVLWNLMRAQHGLKRRHDVCKIARKLYTQHPGDPIIASWGADLPKTLFEGQALNCFASLEDLKKRIRNLQHQGQSKKARDEIELLASRSGQLTKFYVDNLRANFLVNEGQVEEAFKMLVPHYNDRSKDYGYLMLLAKASARAGDFQTASGAYFKAYRLTPGSRKGREALFQAAFLSYQNQDYDGASQKFDDFLKKFPSSGLSRDARWYKAWITYLKGDYGQAYDMFASLSKVRMSRKARNAGSLERIRFWMAISLLKQGRLAEAKKSLTNIANDKLFGYYSLAAQARLAQLQDVATQTVTATSARDPSATEPLLNVETPPSESAVETGEPPVAQQPPQTEEEEGENALSQSGDDDAENESYEVQAQQEVPDALPEEVSGEDPQKTSFKDPRLMARFQRAGDLMSLGFNDWAKFELFEIERRTRNRDYLKMLMSEYETVGAFHRSSAIAQEEFGGMRARQGVEKAKYLWQFSYPKAYERTVSSFSKSFKIPQETVWSIMRAESRYKPDALSPVGAVGLMQLMPYTGERVAALLGIEGFQTNKMLEPEFNIRLGSRYLARLSEQLNGQLPLIAAAYNAGPHRVSAWVKSFGKLDTDEFIEHIPFFETRNYVKKVLHNYYVYSTVYGKADENSRQKMLSFLSQPPSVDVAGLATSREQWE